MPENNRSYALNRSFYVLKALGKPQKKFLFSCPATKALNPTPLIKSGHIFFGIFFWASKDVLYKSGQVFPFPPLSGPNTKKIPFFWSLSFYAINICHRKLYK